MKGKVVFITGGSSGIGLACAKVFGGHGARVVITGRNQESLDAACEELKTIEIDCLGVRGDVTVDEDNERAVQLCIERFGTLDVLINNAGITMNALFEHTELAVIKKVMAINFFGTASITHYALPYIKKSKGSIIGMSSIAGKKGLPMRTGYTASKFAMEGFLEALRLEMRPYGVHILVACPHFTESNIRNNALDSHGEVKGESTRNEAEAMPASLVAEKIYRATVKRKRDLIITTQGWLVVNVNKIIPKYVDMRVYNYIAEEKDSPFKKGH